MGLIASKLADSPLIPETLRTEKQNGQMVALPAGEGGGQLFSNRRTGSAMGDVSFCCD